MIKVILWGVTITLIGATAFAALGDLVSSFGAPRGRPEGLAISAGYLYVVDIGYGAPGWIYLCNPTTGSYTSSFPPPADVGHINGLTYVEGYGLYEGSTYTNRVFRCNPTTGSLISSFHAGQVPHGLAPNCKGEYGAGVISLFDYSFGRVFEHNVVTGSRIRTFNVSSKCRSDIAYDFRNNLLWIPSSNHVSGYSPANGSLYRSFVTTIGNSNISAAYAGEYLYIGTYLRTSMIWKYHCPGALTITPASLGRIKVIYN